MTRCDLCSKKVFVIYRRFIIGQYYNFCEVCEDLWRALGIKKKEKDKP